MLLIWGCLRGILSDTWRVPKGGILCLGKHRNIARDNFFNPVGTTVVVNKILVVFNCYLLVGEPLVETGTFKAEIFKHSLINTAH